MDGSGNMEDRNGGDGVVNVFECCTTSIPKHAHRVMSLMWDWKERLLSRTSPRLLT